MEEIKTKKKLNKKPLIICLLLALVFGIVGFIDIKSNAAEGKLLEVVLYTSSGQETVEYSTTLNYTEDYELYWYAPSDTFYDGYFEYFLYVVSKQHSGLGDNMDYGFVMNGETFYVTILRTSSGTLHGAYKAPRIDGKVITKVDKGMYHAEFAQNYIAGNIKPDVDYDNLLIDDNMLIPENLKRNVITNEDLELGDFRGAIQRYDYITWKNTSEVYQLELQVMPVVQYFQMKLNENKFTKEFYGEWITQEIFDEVTNSYTICTYSTDLSQPVENKAYVDGLNLKSECDDKYSKGFLEENYLNFAYRIRYVDVENGKAGCWLTLVPSNEFDSYDVYVEYADSSLSDKTDGNGLHNEYTNLEDIENAKTDITTENDFKDKYGVTTGDIDTSQATNWLYSVVDFIKTTPQMVGVVLAFLPQPILYGMYITIFLGCIASAIAIVKALI